jgi:hypothetical protein
VSGSDRETCEKGGGRGAGGGGVVGDGRNGVDKAGAKVVVREGGWRVENSSFKI